MDEKLFEDCTRLAQNFERALDALEVDLSSPGTVSASVLQETHAARVEFFLLFTALEIKGEEEEAMRKFTTQEFMLELVKRNQEMLEKTQRQSNGKQVGSDPRPLKIRTKIRGPLEAAAKEALAPPTKTGETRHDADIRKCVLGIFHRNWSMNIEQEFGASLNFSQVYALLHQELWRKLQEMYPIGSSIMIKNHADKISQKYKGEDPATFIAPPDDLWDATIQSYPVHSHQKNGYPQMTMYVEIPSLTRQDNGRCRGVKVNSLEKIYDPKTRAPLEFSELMEAGEARALVERCKLKG